MKICALSVAGLTLLIKILCATPAFAANRVLVLSGGNDPAADHYSQYLQTRLLANGMKSLLGASNVNVMFAGGNSPQTPRLLADVNHEITQGGGSVLRMEFGEIDGNAAATKSNVLSFLAGPEVQSLTAQDTFFLFVSDHGMPNEGDKTFSNNCINLWSFDVKGQGYTIPPFDQACLSQRELQAALAAKVHAGRVVFAMSQCYSGGFHQMSVREEQGYPTANGALCGFTAVTEDTTASGCTANVDGPNYKGYERYFTEALTGRDVVSGLTLPETPKASPREAHLAAALKDPTKDIPLATSDYFLLEWAKRFDQDTFKPRTADKSAAQVHKFYLSLRADSALLQELSSTGGELGEWLPERLSYLKRSAALMAATDPSIAALVQSARGLDLEAAVSNSERLMTTSEAQAGPLDEQAALIRFQKIFPAWQQLVNGGGAAGFLSPVDLAREKKYGLMVESRMQGREDIASALGQAMERLSAIRKASEPQQADDLIDFAGLREEAVEKWLQTSRDARLQQAVQQINQLGELSGPLWETYSVQNERRDHLRRVLLTQKIIAAAATLEFMGDQKALADLRGLLACEKTAL